MRRIETWIQRLNRRRELQRWLAEQRQECYQQSGLSLWLEQDLTLHAPVGQTSQPEQVQQPARVPANRKSTASFRLRHGITPV